MEYRIQSIVFPTEEKHQQCIQLFYRGDKGFLDRARKELHLGPGQTCDFTTYFNACSYRKWRKYTSAGALHLYLDVEGDVSICFVGFHKEQVSVVRHEYGYDNYVSSERRIIHFSFPENEEMMNGFEFSAVGNCVLYGGYYTVECDEARLNKICLSIATTTHRKEAFIKSNIDRIKTSILSSKGGEIAENLFVHVVDNGRTLTDEDINGDHIFLHPNKNTGGSGGYARGMIESIHQEPRATHVLLMDDDIEILPESIIRTYNLLRLMKPEYREYFISGAMLYLEEPEQQHEDMGYVKNDGYYSPRKPQFHMDKLSDCLENEKEYSKFSTQYSAWWYCCIPRTAIEKNGLPLPLFIRGDDVEYGQRCKADFITMNAISVWHMGFEQKTNIALSIYQECRNGLIGKAASGIMSNVDLYTFWVRTYRKAILQFNYGRAELALRAMEDYMKGPSFIEQDMGERIVKENSKLNEIMHPLSQYPNVQVKSADDVYYSVKRKPLDTILYRISYNGQAPWWPPFLHKKGEALVGSDWDYQSQKIALKKYIMAVNPNNGTGNRRELDRDRFKQLHLRYLKIVRNYQKNHEKIEKEYRDAFSYLTSEEFWREYLDL